jgi:hypothetical protein
MSKPTKKQQREELAEIHSRVLSDLDPERTFLCRHLDSGNFVFAIGFDPDNYHYIIISRQETKALADYIHSELQK